MILRIGIYKNHPGHGDQGKTNLSKVSPYASIDEPLLMTLKNSLSCPGVSRWNLSNSPNLVEY